MNDNAIPFGKTAEEIIHEATADYDYPVCFGFPAGHLPENNALRFGQEVKLDVQKDQLTLTF
jgi:muramoyltetrapeptide carboxypeptidase